MARKTGQIVRRGANVWLVRTYSGRDPETKKRIYIAKTVHGGIRDAQAELNRMLSRRDLGRNIRSSRQTLGDYLDHWLEICAKPRLRPRSFRDYAGLLARYVRPQLGAKRLSEISGAEIQLRAGSSEIMRSKVIKFIRWAQIRTTYQTTFSEIP